MKYFYLIILIFITSVVFATNDVVVVDLIPNKTQSSLSAPTKKNTISRGKAIREFAHKSGDKIKLGNYGMFISDIGYIYQYPKPGSKIVGVITYQDVVIVKKQESNYYGILLEDGVSIGWIVTGQLKTYNLEVWANQETNLPDKGLKGYNKNKVPQSKIILQSYSYLKTPYVFGGTSITKGMDCSAFVQDIFKKLYDINLPRTARQQATVGIDIPINQNLMKEGDRLYFRYKNSYIDHTGIYLGNGYYIHCNSAKHGVSIDYLWDAKPSSKLVSVKRLS